jgi:gliding motility-associated-like protein
MMFNFFKRISNILLIPPLLFFANEVVAQCDVFIEPGSVVVTDNGSGVKFEFDITNNSSTDWYGDDLKMYWSLNSGAPIWNIDYSQNTNQPPIGPGETRTIKTPWFDIPNLPSWFPDDPTTAQPWVESMEWPYYNLSFPFQGSWSPMNLRLGSCGLADGAWVYGPDGELYYGPFNTDCPDVNNDAMCDCDLEITSFDPVSLDIEVEVVSHWNCGQPLNGLSNSNSANTDAVGMIHFGVHVPGWDYQWGCTAGVIHPGWAFGGWSALNNPNLFLYSGDIYQGNLNGLSLNGCFNEILSSDTISECKEIVLWQINYSQTLNVADGGWAVFSNSGNQTQEYPDFSIIDNTILICGIPDVNGCTDPVASNYNPNANADDGSCEYLYPDANPGVNLNNTTCLDGTPANIYNITIFNPGDDTLFYYCVEIPELNYDECFNGYQIGQYWIEPGGGQTIAQVTIPEGIEQITINVYEAEGEVEGTFSDNIEVFPVVFNGPDPCPIPGCTDPNANNYDPEANEEDGSCTYNVLTLDLGGDIIWTPQGSCVDPFYNQSFVVNNTGEGVVDNFSLEVVVETWDGDIVYEGTQDYNVSIDPNGSYTVSDFPDMYTGDLNYVSVTLTWVNELGQLEVDTQSFNLLLYCWGCTDPEANNYTESEYIFDEVQTQWLTAFPNTQPPSPEQIECTYDIVDIALDTVLYDTGCDENGPYWNPTFYLTNEGNVTITELCIVPDILSTPEIDTVCFNNLNILPGETFLQEWPNFYDWGVLSVRVIDVNGESGVSWNDFGFDEDVADNMYVQIINDAPNCTEGCTDPNAINYNPNAIVDDGSCQYGVTELNYLGSECTVYCDENGPYYYVTTTFQNTGNVTITDFCAEWNVIGGQENIQCFNGTLEPGETIELVYGPFYQNGSGVVWVYLQELNGVVLDPEIGFYENLTCSLNAEEICVYGCTDDTANNYDPDADLDDGSCTYDVFGCTDPEANNYNPNANVDDGSCVYNIFGCTDMGALNYNPNANIDDGTCIYPNYDPCEEFDGSAFAPNAFTPNNDGLNDAWRVITEVDCWNKWELTIFNRWGQVVYEMDDPSQVWNGSFRNGEYYVQDGVYAYTLRAVAWNLETIEITGMITVLR